MHTKRRSLALDILLGAAAGAAGTYLMDKVTTLAYEREPKAAQEREENARGDKTAYVKAAQKLGAPEEMQEAIGQAIHWSLGVGAGALYGVLRNRMRKLGLGSGLAYGAAFWLVMDEGATALLQLTPPPQRFPWQTHARGLAGHLVLGGTIEAAFDAVDLARL
ncbi:MAG TPA: DUF1440 domain-containing protein [Thermoanaerobaculia bacterium]|jgi:hypothetical protein